MKHSFGWLASIALVCWCAGFVPAAAAASESPLGRSIASIEITRTRFDQVRPWNRRSENFRKNGVVIEGRQILTTAEYLDDLTLIRLQKLGRGKWYEGKVEWTDYHANLAVVTVSDPEFWKDLVPLTLPARVPRRGQAQIVRWNEGQFESREATINRVVIRRGKMSFVEHLHLEVDSEIKGAGWCEAIVDGRRLLGLTTSQEGNTAQVTPAPFIRDLLEARRTGNFRGLGYFDFVWQRSENPATHARLGLAGEPRGVVIIDVPERAGRTAVLKRMDLLLQIDGFPIDSQGDFIDPEYGNLMLEGLSTRRRFVGDVFRIKVWRDGREVELDYTLPKADYSIDLVPKQVFDREPEYLVAGGLIFQPLTEPFLRAWGGDWRRRAPFRIGYYANEDPTPERPSRVILSVLPDPYTIGYLDYGYLAVDSINGVRIGRIGDVPGALAQAKDGFHIINLEKGDSIQRLVLDASQTQTVTRRVLERFGIEQESVIHPVAAP